MMKNVSLAVCVLMLLGAGSSQASAAELMIQNKGSDTLVNVAQAWAEAYQKVNPKVVVAISGGGTGTGVAAMINGTADIANASRAMTESEMKQAREHGHDPVEHIVGYDALSIFLHPSNPISQITLAQLRDIYGRDGKAIAWSDLGVTVPGCSGGKIVVVSRQNNSGTYTYFKEAVLGEGKYRNGALAMQGSKDVVDLVEKTPCAIGYSGLAYANSHVKMPCIAVAGGACVHPDVDTARDRSYPIARPLFMYTSGQPQGHIKQYLDWVMSDAGQCIIKEKGYAPVRVVVCK